MAKDKSREQCFNCGRVRRCSCGDFGWCGAMGEMVDIYKENINGCEFFLK
jgi:hypothetical protein